MKLKCIHTSDVHIGLEFKSATFGVKYGKKRRKEILNTFLNIVDRAIEIDAHFLFISGDLFEDEYATISDMKIVSSKFSQAISTNIIIVSGNHDYIHDKSLYNLVKWPKNVHIINQDNISKIEFKELKTTIWGLSWYKKEESEELLKNISKVDNDDINILVTHGDILDKNSKYLPINKSDIARKGFDYVALGHIHKRQFIDERIAYSGSPEPLDFSETGKHGIIEGVISKDYIDMKFKDFSLRDFIIKDININPNMNYLDIIDIIKQSDTYENRNKNLYRIKLNGIIDIDIKIDTEEIEEELSSYFKYVEVIDNTYLDYDLDKLLEENKDNIVGLFISEMKNKDLTDKVYKDALYYGLDVLLSEKVKL